MTFETKEKGKYKEARVGDHHVSTYVNYPVYYLMRHKHDKDAEPTATIIVPTEDDDVGFPVEVATFLRKNFKIDKTTQAEAETFDVLGICPMMDPKQLAKWLATINHDIGSAFTEKGIAERNSIVRRGEHVYDLNPVIKQNEF